MTDQKKKFWSTEMMVAVASIFVGFCALAITAVQTYIMREQQYASVWPSVSFGTGNSNSSDRDSTANFDFFIANRGVGPAILADVKLLYKSRLYNDEQRWELFRKMIGTDSSVNFAYASIPKNRVLQAGESVAWCQFSSSKQAYKLLKEMQRSYKTNEFDLFILYKDVYGNAWVTHKYGSQTEECNQRCWENLLARYATRQ